MHPRNPSEPHGAPGAIVIVGAGPAGLSCALWLKHLGYRPLLVDRAGRAGGQLRAVRRSNRWVLGFPNRTYPDIADLYAAHIDAEGLPIETGTAVTGVGGEPGGFEVRLRSDSDGGATRTVVAAGLVLATGARPRAGETFDGVPGWEPLAASGRLSFFPLDHLDEPERLRGARVAVLGGGDNAHFTAQDVAASAGRVHLLMRSAPRAQRAVRESVAALARAGTVVEHHPTRVTGFRDRPGGIEVRLAGPGGAEAVIEVDRIFVRAGFLPNTECLAGPGPLAGLARDERGYLAVDACRRTSVPFVYAIGDVANPRHPSVVAAIADGALAARAFVDDQRAVME